MDFPPPLCVEFFLVLGQLLMSLIYIWIFDLYDCGEPIGRCQNIRTPLPHWGQTEDADPCGSQILHDLRLVLVYMGVPTH